MTTRQLHLILLLGVFVMLVPGVSAQSPQPANAKSSTEQTALDVLKDMHNRGAEIYNIGDYTGAYRLYEGSLRTVSPFLSAHPALQQRIEAGLASIAKADGAKLQAFRTHELIEEVRTELKKFVGKPAVSGEMKPAPKQDTTPEPGDTLPPPRESGAKPKPTSTPKPAPKPKLPLSGIVTYQGKPLKNVNVMIASLSTPVPRTFTAKVNDDGSFSFTTELPKGKFVALIDDPTGKVPAKFGSLMTSNLRFDRNEDGLELKWDLKD